MSRPDHTIHLSPPDFVKALNALPETLRRHIISWYEADHTLSPAKRTVRDLQFKVAFMADQFAAHCDAINRDAEAHGGWHKTAFVNRHVDLQLWGCSIGLRPDGTYCLSDTSGG